ncbi:MAG TPA: sulfate ABC transporter permease subunit CysW [Symbiobacteriaceae bacterium]
MVGDVALTGRAVREARVRVRREPAVVRWLLIGAALLFLGLLLVVPLVAVFTQALDKGLKAYWDTIRHPETLSAVGLTLMTAAVAVPLNFLFGVAAAWALTRFRFPGKSVLVTLIDIPFAVSPVIAGLIFVLTYGTQGLLGPWLESHGIRIIFAQPGIILATLFVTLPFVARNLIPLMQAQGFEEEEAALMLGASGWQILWRVTLPNVKWSLLYGVLLTNARAMGEFGAVSVVSGHIRGLTNTLPLHVEILYNEYDFAGAFAAATLLVMLALVTLVAQHLVESRRRKAAEEPSPVEVDAS